MTDELRPAFATPLADLGLTVEDVAVVPAGAGRVLRVLVDRDLASLDPADAASRVPPLSLDEVADATRAVSDVLDATELMGPRPYTLEVSSPGVDRPLRGWRALRRNVGRLVSVTLRSGETATGRVVSVEADEVCLDLPVTRAAGLTRRAVPLGDIISARVQVEFAQLPADGAGEVGDESEEGR